MNTTHTIKDDITELQLRFDTAPKMLVKQDYKHLVHTIEHLESSTNVKEWRKGIQKAVSKSKGLKYTDDGFAIADKSLTARGYFCINEVIAVPNTDNVKNKFIAHGVKAESDHKFDDLFRLNGFQSGILSGIIFIVKTKKDEDNKNRRPIDWDGDINSLDLIILGKSSKIFVKHHSQKYIDGRRVDYIIPRSIRVDSKISGRIEYSIDDVVLPLFFNKIHTSKGEFYRVAPGVTFSRWGYTSGTRRKDETRLVRTIGWRRMPFDRSGKRAGATLYIELVLYFLGRRHEARKVASHRNAKYTIVKVDVADKNHGRVLQYKFRLIHPYNATYKTDNILEYFAANKIKINEFTK